MDDHGSYAISAQGFGSAILVSGVAAQVGGQWVRSSDYPKHAVEKNTVKGYLAARGASGGFPASRATWSGTRPQEPRGNGRRDSASARPLLIYPDTRE